MLLDSTDAFTQMYSPIGSILNSSSSLPPMKRRASDHKVELPLTPIKLPLSTPTKKGKSVSFREMVHEYIPKTKAVTTDTEDAAANSQASLDAFFDEIIEPFAIQANQIIEQEQLQEADSLLRVVVPIVDFSQPVAPWKSFARRSNGKYREGETELMSQQKLLFQVKQQDLKIFSCWPSVMRLERQLHWTAIPKELVKLAADEELEDSRYMAIVLDDMGMEDVVVSDTLTWKPEGLRVLDDLDESEEEIETAGFEENEYSDIERLVRKRRLELVEPVQMRAETGPHQKKLQIAMPVRTSDGLLQRPDLSMERISTDKAMEHGSEMIFRGELFSASAALSNFMYSQGKASSVQRVTPERTLHSSIAPETSFTLAGIRNQTFSTENPAFKTAASVSIPQTPQDPDPRSFVISTLLLREQRSLMRVVERLYRKATFFERDFSALPTVTEADMILSPTTGIVLTTLQKIKQRALPGQEATSGSLKERLSSLSIRYDRVLLLVNYGCSGNGIPRDLDQRDHDALAELKEFARSLGSDTQVIPVMGGDEVLGRWIVTYMLRYGSVRREDELQHEETMASFYLICFVIVLD
jgi:hypothetical protein